MCLPINNKQARLGKLLLQQVCLARNKNINTALIELPSYLLAACCYFGMPDVITYRDELRYTASQRNSPKQYISNH